MNVATAAARISCAGFSTRCPEIYRLIVQARTGALPGTASTGRARSGAWSSAWATSRSAARAKTPVVEMLAKALHAGGRKVAILSPRLQERAADRFCCGFGTRFHRKRPSSRLVSSPTATRSCSGFAHRRRRAFHARQQPARRGGARGPRPGDGAGTTRSSISVRTPSCSTTATNTCA